jgi:alanine racemase
VLSLRGAVLSLKRLRQGEGVSYGYTHRAPRDTVVALVTGGYAQGVARSLGNAASVMIAGERHPIIGRVAMDVCVVDVGADSGVSRGVEVVYFGGPGGPSPALAEWTDASGLTAGELVTAIGLRNDREYVA